MRTKLTKLIERLLFNVKVFLLCLVMTIFKKDFIKKKLFNLNFFNISILTASHDRLLKSLKYPTDVDMFTLEEKKHLILLKKYVFPSKSKKWKSPVDYPLKIDREILIAHRNMGHYDNKNFPSNYNQFKRNSRDCFSFTNDYNHMLISNKRGLSDHIAKTVFLKHYRNSKKKALLKWRDDILKANDWTEQEFNEVLFKTRIKLDLKKKLQSEEIINNFIKKHHISKKNSIDLSYATLTQKKRLKRKKDWLHYMEVNAKKDFTKSELRIKLHEEVPWSTFSDKEIPMYIKTRKGFLKQSDILGIYPKSEDIKLPRKLLKKFKRSSYHDWKIDKIFPDHTSRSYDIYTSEASPWWQYKYDLDDDGTPFYTLREEDFYSWFEATNIFSHIYDQYIIAVPIMLILLCVHWILVETLLYKFKCQQHYHINTFLLGTWFLILTYWFFNRTEAPFGFYKYGFFATSEWPLYFVIIKWIFFLLAYLVILIVFLSLAPKTPFLRSKVNMRLQHYIFFFVPCFIGLLFSLILIPKRLPFANIFQDILLLDCNKVQFHYGYVYYIFILLFISFTALLFFYIIVSLKYFILYYRTKDKKYLNYIVSFLFAALEDESDLLDYKGKLTLTRLPEELVSMTEDWDSENFKIPDGYVYIFRDIYNYVHIWVGSYSRNIFLRWYFTTFLYGWFVSYLYVCIELPTLLFFTFFFFILMLFFYIGFIFKYFPDLNKPWRVRHLLVLLILGLFLFLFFFIFFQDALYVLGL